MAYLFLDWNSMCCCCCKKQIRKLRQEIATIKFLVSRPGRLKVHVVKEEDGMLYFVFSLPVPGAADVATRELTVSIAGADPVTVSPAIGDTESQEFSGNDNDTIHAELVDIDDADNRSTPSVYEGVLTDTLAPPQPGELGVKVVREE
jgi:hypothetical protein